MSTMQAIDPVLYTILIVVIVVWCVLHSTMIAQSVTDYLKHRLGEKFRFFRLFFNLIAIITLIPIVIFANSLRTEPLFSWDGYWHIVQGLMLGIGLILFWLGARNYDSRQFFGLAQIQGGTTGKALTRSGKINTSGILNVVRHPWYLAGILMIWARPLDISAIIVNILLTSYFIIGSYLEEKKLVSEFGESYRLYQQQVSMLVPYKWLQSKMGKRR